MPLAHSGPLGDVAAAHHPCQLEDEPAVVLADVSADELVVREALRGGDPPPAEDGEKDLAGRAVADVGEVARGRARIGPLAVRVGGDRVGLREEEQVTRLPGAHGDGRGRDGHEDVAVQAEQVVAGAGREALGDPAGHGGRATARGNEADAELDEADVRLGQGLGPVGGEHELRPAAECAAAWRDDDRDRHVPDRLGGRLEAPHDPVELAPLALLGFEEHERQVRAGAEVRRGRADDEAVILARGQLHRPLDHRDRVESDDVQLAVELQAQDAVAQVEDGGCRVRREHRPPGGREVEGAGARIDRLVPVRAEAPRPAVSVCRLRPVDLGQERRRGIAQGVHELEGPEVPAEAPAHGGVDVVHALRDLRPDAGGIGQVGGQRSTEELAGGVLGGQQGAHALRGIGLVAGHLHRPG